MDIQLMDSVLRILGLRRITNYDYLILKFQVLRQKKNIPMASKVDEFSS